MNKRKILLVDDDANLRETMLELLTHHNYEVKTASNGQKALQTLNDWFPDLIISDMMMPVMDGHAFHELVKENVLLSSIPFVFLTAKLEEDQMRKYLNQGADDYVPKPFNIKYLIEIIESRIERFEKIKNANRNIYLGDKKHFSHEINTPLNGILGSIDLLIDNKGLDQEDVFKFYEAIKISGARLHKTMQNVMHFQNLKSDTLVFDTTSTTAILDDFLIVKTKIADGYENQEKRIIYEIDKANLKICEKYLQFILFELIDNALKFSPDNRNVMVSGTINSNDFYELVIKDFGIGFSENELNKIGATQQFNRDEKEQQGLGLGLFLSRIIVKKFQGVFSISSKEKEGTTIKIELPIST
ncbi:ATP-binding response regulator [Flavobacterium sp. W22_SRS_FP1]|uniref:ATP-binding response regulator n=1 Tax=Flavobacterium sp. W22_SRS_FP1 TaxID=3240276 RepID=UPI003F92E44F